jgi:hypothetical protein
MVARFSGGRAMGNLPATTVKVTSVEPVGETKVRIIMELCVDVNRMAEVSGEMMRSAVAQMNAQKSKKKK